MFSKSKGAGGGTGDTLSNVSQTRCWACLADGFLYLYTRQGAALRAIIDLKCCTSFQFVPDDAGTADRLSVSIKLQGLPPLILTVGDHMESWRWKFAFLNSYRYASFPLEHFDLYKHRNEMASMISDLSSDQLKKIIAHNEGKQIQTQTLHKKALQNASSSTNSTTLSSASASTDNSVLGSDEESPSTRIMKSSSINELNDGSIPPPPPKRMMARVASIGSLDTSTS